MVRSFVVAALALAASAAQAWALPDLVVSQLRVTPANAEVGEEVLVETAISNVGDMPVRVPGPSMVSTSSDLAIMRTQVNPIWDGAYLTGWGPTRDIPPGGTETYSTRVRVPATAPAHAGYVCAVVDNPERVAETNETNNRRCVNFHARAAKANLFIRSFSVGAVSGVSRRLRIVVENTGRADALNFRVDAFQLSPRRWPLLFTTCALTARGGAVPCPSPWIERLAPGERRTVDAWVTFPADIASGSRQSIELYVDGCHAPTEPALPAHCRVDETNETDNARRVTIVAP